MNTTWQSIVPYLLIFGAAAAVIAAFYWQFLSERFKMRYDSFTPIFLIIVSIILVTFSMQLNYKKGYEASFPSLGSGEVGTVLSIYDPDISHDSQKIQNRKRCLVRLKDGRETVIREDKFYHKEVDDIIPGDLVIQEAQGYIYVLRQVNIHRTLPPTLKGGSGYPFVEEFTEENKK